jgi:DNA-binding winged helix-turn-helix (wHTH) protein
MNRSEQTDEPSLYRYSFGGAEFDEARSELRVAGLAVELEQRPLQLLACLLHRADEVVSREELFDTVWAGRPTVDNVLANAMTKLRKALGTDGARILTVPRVGYRLVGPVERIASGRRLRSRLYLAVGQEVPGREHFRLREQLGPSHGTEIWLARHDKTPELRVYKFSTDGERLAVLKREATIYRLLHKSLGERDDFVRVIDWNFDNPPFYLECEYGGPDLAHWADGTEGLAALGREERIHLFLQIADAMAAAHGVGVLHKDIKPANILLMPRANGVQARLADFGSSRLLEPGRLEELGITAMGLTMAWSASGDSEFTPLYVAPELLAGHPHTVQSDVYALGLVLYQLLVGDLRRPLAPGWDVDIDDELLREDVAAATDGSPRRRLAGVRELCERLRGRDTRRIERARLRDAEARAQIAEQQLDRSRARRPWIVAALTLLLAGLGASLWQFQLASRARDDARQQAAIATASNRFLNEDLLGAGSTASPAWYEKNPRLDEILDAAALRLDERYRNAPLLAAGLHQTLGRAYRSTGEYAKALAQLQVAVDLLRDQLGTADEHSLLAEYELAVMQAHLSHFADASARLDRADVAAGVRRQSVSEIALRSHLARGDLFYQQMKVQPALDNYRAAQTMQKILHPDDAMLAAHILTGIAGCDLRLDRAADAEHIARIVLAGQPYTEQRVGLAILALARSRLADALRAQARYGEAIVVSTQAVADYQKSQGPSGQGTISALSTLGYLYSLNGDPVKSLAVQRDVYHRSLERWGKGSQYTLVEQLNLGSQEAEVGDLTAASQDLRAASVGLTALAGDASPTVQAARVAEASVLSDLGRNQEALVLIATVDPDAYQASTSDPGRAALLKAMRARIMLRLDRHGEALPELRKALQEMQLAGVSRNEMDPFRKLLAVDVAAK